MSNLIIEKYENDPEGLKLFQQEYLAAIVTDLMSIVMKEKKIKKSELAARLSLTKGRISQILDCRKNITLRTVADIFTAMEMQLNVSAESIYTVSPFPPRISQKSDLGPWACFQVDNHGYDFMYPCTTDSTNQLAS